MKLDKLESSVLRHITRMKRLYPHKKVPYLGRRAELARNYLRYHKLVKE